MDGLTSITRCEILASEYEAAVSASGAEPSFFFVFIYFVGSRFWRLGVPIDFESVQLQRKMRTMFELSLQLWSLNINDVEIYVEVGDPMNPSMDR